MRVLIATDSFKGSLTSYEAGVAISEGIKKAVPGAVTVVKEIADGGEGTFEIVTRALRGDIIKTEVTGPLGDRITASYGISGTTAVIDISQACGLPLVPEDRRDPLYTTTRGVGELILDALDRGCRRFIIGLGGSSTNDCGAGMLLALGVKITGRDGRPVKDGAVGLADVSSVDGSDIDDRIAGAEFLVACDVDNPLCGDRGCSMIFAPQKGADHSSLKYMDDVIRRFAELAGGDPDLPGSGAAGGLGYAMRTFLGGRLVPGADLVISQTGLKEQMTGADIVITGEGCLDAQTSMGKAPSVIAGLAKASGIKVLAFAGCIKADADTLNLMGIDEAYSISDNVSQEEAMRNAASLLTRKAYEVFDGRPF